MARILLLILLLCANLTVSSQATPGDTLVRPLFGVGEGENDSLTYIAFQANNMFYSFDGTMEIDTLIGDVELIQDSLALYCDSAILKNQQYADAYSNVVIIHEDRVQIFSDSGKYDGVQKTADLYGEVILQEEGRSLFTTELFYDLSSKVATYDSGGTIIDQDRNIISRDGIYDTKKKKATLFGNVAYRDSTMKMVTDSVIYFTDIEQLDIVAPTYISQDSADIYCESGVYRLKIDQGVLSQNVQVKTKKETITSGILEIDGKLKKYTFWLDPIAEVTDGIASADTIIYFETENRVELIGNAIYEGEEDTVMAPSIIYFLDTEEYQTLGRAQVVNGGGVIEADDMRSEDDGSSVLIGNVSIVDEEQGTEVTGDYAIKRDTLTKIYNTSKSQPEMSYLLSDSKLHVKADTLISLEVGKATDTLYRQEYGAVGKVQLITGDVMGKSGIMSYLKQDSIITLLDDPILWSDSVQLTADTILIYLSNNKVSKIEQRGNAFILSPDENGNLNQIKSKEIDSFIEDGKIKNTFARRNVELCYLALQEGEYKAINTAKSSSMSFTFDNAEIETVKVDGSQESKMYEYKDGMDVTLYYLEGHRWRIEEMPVKKEFLLYANL